ncbi:hypothetical protein CAPTEDRAFT_208874 [Capitella teleta]|uniref:Uncharacterized protein n=1 Tax=Capitella teleta TaxID=283909 RepID=R7UW43_CAPTE|nr:hypothetical protein CAPTEDRAFT_208874 [Capitella teleta]|eukprot:ELU08152.1 hypothetical protein CAPTEDRAFT_208874 [Capitella teleta]
MDTNLSSNQENSIDDWKHLEISVNLIEAALRHLYFLQQFDQHPDLYSAPVAMEAIRRYETIWLPLAATHPNDNLVPPLDIHWAWHCHMLSPSYYGDDCLTLVGKVIDNNLLSLDEQEYKRALEVTKHHWANFANGEPFHVLSPECPSSGSDRYTSRCSRNLMAVMRRQRLFNYQVTLPHYMDPEILAKALNRYKKYLALKRRYPEEPLVPILVYDFDLLWHTHQLYPILYRKDTTKIFGCVLSHGYSNDPDENAKLNTSDIRTRELWKQSYFEDFFTSGGMFRSEPIQGRLHTMPNLLAERSTIIVHGVRLCLAAHDGKQSQILKLSLISRNGSSARKLLKFKGTEWKSKTPCIFEYNVVRHAFLQFDLTEKKDNKQSCSTHHYSLAEILNTLTAEQNMQLNIPLQKHEQLRPSAGCSVALCLKFGQPTSGIYRLSLLPSPFQSVKTPDNAEDLWGPIPLPMKPTDDSGTCSVALHRIFNEAQQLRFIVKVIHSKPLMTSALQVFHQEQMIAIAHMIGNDQLPQPAMSQENKYPTLDYSEGERALLIKDNIGDWAIVVGKWIGFEKAVPEAPGIPQSMVSNAVPTVPGVPGSPGKLSASVYYLRDTSANKIYYRSEFAYEVGDIQVDAAQSKITLLPKCSAIGQNICLAMSVGLLHDLCQPNDMLSSSGLTMNWTILILIFVGLFGVTTCMKIERNAKHQMRDLDEETQKVVRSALDYYSVDCIYECTVLGGRSFPG